MVDKSYRTFIYVVFFLSGMAGLIYQVVWTRMLYLIFGVSTQSIVSVTSAFMAGLALGSYISGRLSPKQINILRFYAVLELAIGLTAIILPFIFQSITVFYTFIYHLTGSAEILWILKFLLTFIAILIPTTAMGATLPAFIEFVQRHFKSSLALETGILYAVNTFGAFAGVLLAGFVLIEVLGLIHTMWFAIAINLMLGIIMWQVAKGKIINKTSDIPQKPMHKLHVNSFGLPLKLALLIFALSGLISMVYEIAWTRLLTPITGTFIYAFSFILALILLGIALGSLTSKFLIGKVKSPLFVFALIEFAIGAGAVLSVLATTDLFHLSTILTEMLVILPATIAMGMTFPVVMMLVPQEIHGSTFAGTSYTFNTVGSMLGPIIGGFILLPRLGSSGTVITLSCANFIFAAILAISDLSSRRVVRASFVFVCISVILFLSVISKIDVDIFTEKTRKALEAYVRREGHIYRFLEDESASVAAFNSLDGRTNGLLVDGIGMTSLVVETKLMAHLPILLHTDPKDMLIICFGMGTTYRSALTYGINADSVELIPSVVKMFPIFFQDAEEVLRNPKGKIIINDGRNYVRLTRKKYDIIQVDPPPPVNAAGTTVLYSQEFYEDSKKILKDNGIFIQWIFSGSREDDINMLIRSFVNAFPYVSAFKSPYGAGIFLLGSEKPIKIDESRVKQRLLDNPKAFNDLNEWGSWDAARIISLYIGDKNMFISRTAHTPPVTDMFPKTEYFLLRHNLAK